MYLNYESDINTLLIDGLKRTFNVNYTPHLHTYLLSRFILCERIKDKILTEELKSQYMRYLLRVLGIVGTSYKDEPLSFYRHEDNSMLHILDDWSFRMDLENGKTIEDVFLKAQTSVKECVKVGVRMTKKYRQHSEYNNLLREKIYDALNEMFKVSQNIPIPIEGFQYDENYVPEEFYLTKRNKLVLNEMSQDIKVTERKLEDYLYRNLEVLENGLSPISRQVILPHGVVDILAAGVEGEIVIIELKVEDDKDLLWQERYYKEEIEKRYPNKKVRFMVVSDDFKESTIRYLDTNDIYTFTPKVCNGEIHELEIRRAI